MHKRLEKTSAALRGLPEIAGPIAGLDAVILQRGVEEKTIVAFPVLHGTLGEPLVLNFGDVTAEPRSAEAVLKRALEPEAFDENGEPLEKSRGKVTSAAEPAPPGQNAQPSAADVREQFGMKHVAPQLAEHLSLISRWFYSKPRDGEILFREDVWPYRRMLRACARLPPRRHKSSPPSRLPADSGRTLRRIHRNCAPDRNAAGKICVVQLQKCPTRTQRTLSPSRPNSRRPRLDRELEDMFVR